MEDLDGFAAVLLWQDYRTRQDVRALETLQAYNVQDVLNLEALMVEAYNRNLDDLSMVSFAAGYRLPVPALPANPFRPDPESVSRVIRQRQGYFNGRG
jgi:hypothetical protein